MERLEEGTSSRPNGDTRRKHSLPEPRFDGSRREDLVADFLYDCDRYFGNRQLSDESKVLEASYFLTDEAKSWWRQREECGNWPPPTYEEFVQEIKESFMPHNTAWILRGKLKNLKMMGNPREYVGQFVSIIWRITDMFEADKLYRFAKGLPHWLQTELERRQCRDLNSAYKVVENTELRPARPAKTEDRPMKGYKPRQERAKVPTAPSSQGLKRKFKHGHGKGRDKGKSPRLWKQSPSGGGNKLICFAYGGPHFMRDCPRGTATATNVNAMVVPPPQQDVPRGSSTVNLNPLQCLAALQGGTPLQYEGLNLLHVSVLINSKPSMAMVDTGATHNIFAEKEAKKLGLKLSPSAGKIKAVNLKARDIVGVANGVLLQYRGVLFPEGSHPCLVRDKGVQKPRNTALLSAMQIKDGLRKGEETFLVTIRGPTPQKKGERQGEPVLRMPKFNKPYEVHTDASDFALGGALMQDGHPVAYESRKLNDVERRYSVHVKEMTAVVHCLRVWRHYLLGGKFVVYTNNVATNCFESQKKLIPKQARSQDFLAEFDFDLKYKLGRANQVADALSRKEPEVFVPHFQQSKEVSSMKSSWR
ncbi:uncharacterized protein LOC144703424 [Wolffia australiana]